MPTIATSTCPALVLANGRQVIINYADDVFEDANPQDFTSCMREKDHLAGGNLRRVGRWPCSIDQIFGCEFGDQATDEAHEDVERGFGAGSQVAAGEAAECGVMPSSSMAIVASVFAALRSSLWLFVAHRLEAWWRAGHTRVKPAL